MGKVIAVCISEKRGTQKKNINEANFIKNFGIENDAHAGDWHRQVSLLSYEKIDEFNKRGANVIDGAFGENIVVEGIELSKLPIGTILRCNDVILEMTQIGKECHNGGCAIKSAVGDCVMPREGIFTKVIKDGLVKTGDEIKIIE